MTDSGISFVVKRFYRLSDDEDKENRDPLAKKGPHVSIDDNKGHIQAEISRFFPHSTSLRRPKGIDVCRSKSLNTPTYFNDQYINFLTAICFVEAFLGLEDQLNLSIASGHDTTSTVVDSDGEGLTWLVEPKRTTLVEHFTHTLNYRSTRNDLLGLTILAFSHFRVPDIATEHSLLLTFKVIVKLSIITWSPSRKQLLTRLTRHRFSRDGERSGWNDL